MRKLSTFIFAALFFIMPDLAFSDGGLLPRDNRNNAAMGGVNSDDQDGDVFPILFDPVTGELLVKSSSTSVAPVTVAQGTSGVDADAWNSILRNLAGVEYGLAASPFGVSLFDAASNLLGIPASPLAVGGTAADGAASSGNPNLIAGEDSGGIVRIIKTGTGGSLSLGADTAGSDTIADFVIFPANLSGTTRLLGVGSHYFNGTNWFRPRGTVANGLDVDVTRLPTALEIDPNNTTTTPLGIGATFTGTATDLITNGKAQLVISVIADQDSATDGLILQFSQDGTNWPAGDYKHAFTLAANVARAFQFGPEAQFFRVVLTNGGVGQSTFRLATILKRNISHTTLNRIDDGIDGDSALTLTKSVLSGKNPSGVYVNFGATNNGNFKVEVDEWSAGLLGGGAEADALLITLANDSTGLIFVKGKDADGAAPSENPLLIAGQDGANVQSLKTDTDGELQIDVLTAPLPLGAPAKDHKSVVTGVGPTLILAADAGRRFVTICNDFTDLVAFGNSDVTLNSAVATDGPVLAASGASGDGTGGCKTEETTGAYYVKGTSASSKVTLSWGTN